MSKATSATSTAYARKLLWDFMDRTRPWAHHPEDIYEAMELIVDYATFAFHGKYRPTEKDIRELDNHLIRFTTPLAEHPDNYDGPCGCAECREDGNR